MKQKLRNLISDSQKQRKRRAEKKQMIAGLAEENPTNAAKLRKFMNKLPVRQPLENLYPDLHQAIIDLVTVGAGADSRRRTDVLNSCKTLDDLNAVLQKEGYILSRQAFHLRLIPQRADSREGRCHVRTVPIKLRKAKNTLRNRHADADFTFAIKRQMRDIVSLSGSDNVFVLSVDNKAKVPISVTAVTKQAPLIMHVSYEIRLPHHDFVKATKHKLTSFVYVACEIKPPSSRADPEITYSGPTYIAIKSGQHDSSTACTHGRDFDQLLGLKEFDKVVKHGNAVKPIGMFFCDGGRDKNPRFPKTLDVAIQHFKKHNLDALLISTHAPGLSAHNQVERRMIE